MLLRTSSDNIVAPCPSEIEHFFSPLLFFSGIQFDLSLCVILNIEDPMPFHLKKAEEDARFTSVNA